MIDIPPIGEAGAFGRLASPHTHAMEIPRDAYEGAHASPDRVALNRERQTASERVRRLAAQAATATTTRNRYAFLAQIGDIRRNLAARIEQYYEPALAERLAGHAGPCPFSGSRDTRGGSCGARSVEGRWQGTFGARN